MQDRNLAYGPPGERFSRVDAAINLALYRSVFHDYLSRHRPHGRWRKALPKADRIPPRDVREALKTMNAIYEQLCDELCEDVG